ncbi:hypothetical protein BCR36DRAFT_359122 [Piromyces finnis]|uniref:Uncharacterized protein n=1 Tax=Piromyces finnis TaxID=1754191 RepID=A0A1Y1V170_9FUNG|nr:hypothetical protein BCR36DRAFT_359122 [Piromyces finnis]|eukprot:ORX44852.1 hypothetical protein BCR36DRAFT_359122 [Piromyces finnis]
MDSIDKNNIVINVEKEPEKSKKVTFSCFRIGDSSSKAFVIRVSTNNQIYSIKEHISKSFEPRIIPRYLKLFVPIEEEIFPYSPQLSSIKSFNKAKHEGTIKVVEIEKPLKKISDEEYLLNRIKGNPEALDIIILDDNLQRSIDNFVSNSMAEISFGSRQNLVNDNNSTLSKEKLFQNNGSSSNFLSYESSASLYSKNHKNSKVMKSIEKVEKKISIKNKKVRITVSIVAVLVIILIVGFTWIPRTNSINQVNKKE